MDELSGLDLYDDDLFVDDGMTVVKDEAMLYWSAVLARKICKWCPHIKISWNPRDVDVRGANSFVAAAQNFLVSIDSMYFPVMFWADSFEEIVDKLTYIPHRMMGFRVTDQDMNPWEYREQSATRLAVALYEMSEALGTYVAKSRVDIGNLLTNEFGLSEPIGLSTDLSRAFESVAARRSLKGDVIWLDFCKLILYVASSTGIGYLDTSFEMYFHGTNDYMWTDENVQAFSEEWREAQQYILASHRFEEWLAESKRNQQRLTDFVNEAIAYVKD